MFPRLLFGLAIFSLSSAAVARDWYVSPQGRGKKGTIEKPAKDLGNIVGKLAAGDVVHIAGGTYLGKGQNGHDLIKVPVSVIGGYDPSFKTRDPWGAHKTILSGDVMSKNFKQGSRFAIDLTKYRGKEMPAIVVDGLIVDQGGQNRYKTPKKLHIARKANPKTGENPTPDRGALRVSVSKTGNFSAGAHWDITVRNNVVLNSAPTEGAMSVKGYEGSVVRIHNNLVVNNTGVGIYAGSNFHGKKGLPVFDIDNNTVLFTWKYDAYVSSFSGISLQIKDSVVARVRNNLLGFSDRVAVQKEGKLPLLLKDNLLVGHVETEYWEAVGDAKIALADLLDEAEFLDDKSDGNIGKAVKIPLSQDFTRKYGARVLIDRNAAEAKVKPAANRENALRSMLGIPLQAASINVGGAVWLPLLELDDGLKAGLSKYLGKYGSSQPKP